MDDLKALGIEELEKRAAEADRHIHALNHDETEEGIRARQELVRVQNLLNMARSELLKDKDLPSEVVVGMKPAYMRPRMVRGGAMTLEQTDGKD
jgi:hypothetical protein